MSEEKKDDIEAVLDFAEVAGFKIRPWGLLALKRLSPHLERVILGLQARGLSFDEVKSGKGIEKLLFSVLPECADIVGITLGISLEEVDKIPAKDVPVILLTIARLNMEYLKNWQGPIMAKAKEAVA
jgi:hypothetical protein